MSKLWSTIDKVKSVEDLKNMQMPDGSKFVRPEIDNDVLEKATKALKDLSLVRAELQFPSVIIAANDVATSFADRLWGVWYYIRDKVNEGIQWVINKAEDGWRFVVEIAGRAWNFLLTNAPQVAEAMQKILETITNGWEWLKKKFDVFFSWIDILDVTNAFVNLTIQGLLWGVDSIDSLELNAKDYFDDPRKKVRALKAAKLPPELANITTGSSTELQKQSRIGTGNKPDAEEILKSPSAQYGDYHLKHSSGGGLGPRTQGQTAIDRLVLRLQEVMNQVMQLVHKCEKNFSELFKSQDIRVETVLAGLGLDMLEDVLGIIESITMGVLGSLSDLLLEFTAGLNKAINIPVLSPLY